MRQGCLYLFHLLPAGSRFLVARRVLDSFQNQPAESKKWSPKIIQTSVLLAIVWLTCAMSTRAAVWYVDSSATAGHDGKSWATAWINIQDAVGVQPDDTVYISGGPSGQTRAYNVGSGWHPISGTSGHRVTYEIGQDSAHNGTAIFQGTSAAIIYGPASFFNFAGDAGDGKRHFSIPKNAIIYDGAIHDFRIAWIDGGSSFRGFWLHANNNQFHTMEWDHCFYHKLDDGPGGNDAICYMSNSPTTAGFDDTLIHDNVFEAPNTGNGDGDDFFQGTGDGVTWYNNVFRGYITSYTNGQHQDGIQPLGGSYLKFHSNTCINIANYPVFGDAYYGDFAHFWVFNNVIILADANMQKTDPPQGIAIGPDGGAFSNMGRQPTFTDILIANNVIDGYGSHSSISLWNPTNHATTFTNCVVANNVTVNGSGMRLDPQDTVQTNLTGLTPAQAQSVFKSYSANSTTNDYDLLSTASQLIGRGTNKSANFTTDKDGNLRPTSGAWDLGAHEH